MTNTEIFNEVRIEFSWVIGTAGFQIVRGDFSSNSNFRLNEGVETTKSTKATKRFCVFCVFCGCICSYSTANRYKERRKAILKIGLTRGKQIPPLAKEDKVRFCGEEISALLDFSRLNRLQSAVLLLAHPECKTELSTRRLIDASTTSALDLC